MKKLSIVIPSYKQPKLLDRALESLIHQSFKDFDVIILDDASGIDYDEIISSYNDALDIRVVKNQKNLGAMTNMFASIQFDTPAPYIFSLHEDDFIKNNYLENAINILENNNLVSFVITTPVWIKQYAEYINEKMDTTEYLLFNSSEFIYSALKFKPYIFGSVIYRRNHLIKDWHYPIYGTFCDKYFLATILEHNNSNGAILSDKGIFVRDHSQDKNDNRSSDTTEDNAINIFVFYKKILKNRYDNFEISKLITNGLLLSYNSLKKKTSLMSFYTKQKPYNLIKISAVNSVGFFSIITLPLTRKSKVLLLQKSKTFAHFLLKIWDTLR